MSPSETDTGVSRSSGSAAKALMLAVASRIWSAAVSARRHSTSDDSEKNGGP